MTQILLFELLQGRPFKSICVRGPQKGLAAGVDDRQGQNYTKNRPPELCPRWGERGKGKKKSLMSWHEKEFLALTANPLCPPTPCWPCSLASGNLNAGLASEGLAQGAFSLTVC